MDPGEDIIDILYNRNLEDEDRPSSARAVRHRYGFEYHHPPARNYYDDLFQIQRGQFHRIDSVYGLEKRPLRRTDSGTYFSFPSPSRQEKQRRSLIYGTLRNKRTGSGNQVDDSNQQLRRRSEHDSEDFVTPESEVPVYDSKWSVSSNWIMPPAPDRNSSMSSDGGIYNSIDSGIHEKQEYDGDNSSTRVHFRF